MKAYAFAMTRKTDIHSSFFSRLLFFFIIFILFSHFLSLLFAHRKRQPSKRFKNQVLFSFFFPFSFSVLHFLSLLSFSSGFVSLKTRMMLSCRTRLVFMSTKCLKSNHHHELYLFLLFSCVLVLAELMFLFHITISFLYIFACFSTFSSLVALLLTSIFSFLFYSTVFFYFISTECLPPTTCIL